MRVDVVSSRSRPPLPPQASAWAVAAATRGFGLIPSVHSRPLDPVAAASPSVEGFVSGSVDRLSRLSSHTSEARM
eukprot:m.55990 g.55990  ORF g.55990 m.55990 type:complete len:75 (-) comp9286_c0_seq1:126-350(-)